MIGSAVSAVGSGQWGDIDLVEVRTNEMDVIRILLRMNAGDENPHASGGGVDVVDPANVPITFGDAIK